MKKIAIILAAAVILAAGGLSYKLYFAKAGLGLPFLDKKPAQVLNLMMSETAKLGSFAYQNNADIKVDYEVKEPALKSSFLVKEETTGAVNKKNPAEIRAENIFKGSLDLGGMAFSLEMETKKIGQMTYFKMNVMPFIVKMIFGAESENKWYEINEESWEKLSEQGKTQASDIYGVAIKENKEKQDKLASDIKEYIKSNNLLELKERLKDEKINNRKNYHYKASLNQKTIEGVKEILLKFAEEESAAKGLEQDGKELGSIKEMIGQLDKLITKIDLELWIDKNKFYLTRTNFDIDFDFSKINFPEELKAAAGYNLKTNIKGAVNLSKINEDIKIEKPETSEPVDNILEKQSSDLFGLDSAREKSRDANRLADVKTMQTALELYFNDNNRYPASVKAGEPLMAEDVYMPSAPENPLPNDGVCAFDFEYIYMADQAGSTYRIIYCLGGATGGVESGYHVATPEKLADENEAYDPFDLDGDYLSEYEENFYKTDPDEIDTDGDGYDDGEEVRGGFNPLGAGKISQ